MIQIIDRRLNGKNKSAVNRQRFLRRFKGQIRTAAQQAIDGRSITDLTSGEKVNVPARDVREPRFQLGRGGRREMVHPGNREFVSGDRIPRPPGGEGGGSSASNEGQGEDDFAFQLSRDEFLELFFEGLELPDLEERDVPVLEEFKSVRAGFSTDGVPANISIVRSLRGALARRTALKASRKRKLDEARAELVRLDESNAQTEGHAGMALEAPGRHRERALLSEEVGRLERRLAAVPFIDTFDLRYHNRVLEAKPSTKAVMFCLMDVSGSMDERRKDIAKRFFALLHLFLERAYETIDVVFIRHHTTAKEVDEHDFFYARETGGTVVSSALNLMIEVIAERYPPHEWNIYGAQASDGDNWGDDSSICGDLLGGKILPLVQYFAYVEIGAEQHQSLWTTYEHIGATSKNFAMQDIEGVSDIYPVFRKLLKKREGAK